MLKGGGGIKGGGGLKRDPKIRMILGSLNSLCIIVILVIGRIEINVFISIPLLEYLGSSLENYIIVLP